MMLSPFSRHGYMALTAVIILGIVGAILGITLALRGVNEVSRGLGTIQEHKLIGIVDACAEDVLWQYDANPGTPNSPVTVNGGTCTVSVDNLGGQLRGVTITATIERWTRTVYLRVDTGTNPVVVHEWRVVQ